MNDEDRRQGNPTWRLIQFFHFYFREANRLVRSASLLRDKGIESRAAPRRGSNLGAISLDPTLA